MTEFTRRRLLQYGVGTGAGLVLWRFGATGWAVAAPIPGGTLDATSIPKYVTPLVIPPAMPRTRKLPQRAARRSTTTRSPSGSSSSRSSRRHGPADDGLELRLRRPPRALQLPGLHDRGEVDRAGARQVDQPARRRQRQYLPHLLADRSDAALGQPARRAGGTDTEAARPDAVHAGRCRSSPTCTAGTRGRRATASPKRGTCRRRTTSRAGYATVGSYYDDVQGEGRGRCTGSRGRRAAPCSSTTTTSARRPLVPRPHAGHDPARMSTPGRPGSTCSAAARRRRRRRSLPGPAPALGDPPGREYYEIPIAIQDRSFNADGSLFYPDNRAFFEGLDRRQLQISRSSPTQPATAPSDISPIFNPEFFGNTMVVNGRTWPYLEVEQRRYRFRFLNGCNSRFLILRAAATGCRSGRSAPRAASCPPRSSSTGCCSGWPSAPT